MKIGVISDSHNKVPDKILEHLEDVDLIWHLEDVDLIWHLGDVCDAGVLDDILALEKPLKVVRGNCDFNSEWPITLTEEIEGFKFLLVHIPPDTCSEPVDCLLHGHTHVPRDEMIEGVRFLNPGTIGKPNKGAPPSMAEIETKPDGTMEWRIIPI
ncbi:MAG: metallophosphoesterase family protein [Verrucomicrobiota bacterium]